MQTRNGVSQRTGKPYTVHYQPATLETEDLRGPIEVEVDDPTKGYAVGGVYEWQMAKDLTLGRFGVDLGRRMTLVPIAGAAVRPKAA